VLMAASGPKAIELAGEIADGVLLLVGFTPGIVDAVLARLEQGARRSGRRLDDLEIVWAVRTGNGIHHCRSPSSGASHGRALGYSELGEPLAAARWPADPGI